MLEQYNVILASNSPRRKELLSGLDISFEVRIKPGIDESHPANLPLKEIPRFIALRKAEAYLPEMQNNDLIITADTVVLLDGEILEKPSGRDDAILMLRKLSGRTHTVVTAVVITTRDRQVDFSVESEVSFDELDDDAINWYVDNYQPYDKAGAYGIQEWIGYVGVKAINGSFYNVMGLPVQRLYRELKAF
ncbi:MAG: Maf family nucleotide pyrophosphatase [Tannerella sp.]|jgi:septum formation protein|nr:Maf family nucleotide pyrophosphatase [Tannerella sp.]